MVFVDLHIHTYYSDGTDSPEQQVDVAKDKRLDMIAIADHDNLDGYFEAIEPARKAGIGLVSGVEITTIQHHLLALDFDPYDPDFLRFVKRSKDIQRELCGERVKLLAAYGVPITLEKVEERFPHSTLTKYSTSQTMTDDPECRRYLLENHEPEKDGTIKIRSVLSYYLSAGGIAGMVEKKKKIVLKNGINIEENRWVEWKEAISAVHKAGGLAFIAHPALGADNPKDILDLLAGVDGIEVQPQFWEKYVPFIKYAECRGLLVSYGSDDHGKAFDDSGSKILGREGNRLSPDFFDRLKHVRY